MSSTDDTLGCGGDRRPRRTLIGFVALLAVSVGMLVAARLVRGFNSELLLNIGASVVILAFSYVFFDPIFEHARKGRVEEHLRFDHEAFSERVAASHQTVAILETWTGLLEDSHREQFFAALRAALVREVDVRILLLDPDSPPAQQRAAELGHIDVCKLIRDNLRHLHQFRTGLGDPSSSCLSVRVYEASPSIQLYRWDDKALISFFPIGVRAYDAPQIEAYMDSPWGAFVQGRFEELWQHDSTRRMEEYMHVPVTVRLGAAELLRCDAPFVHWNGELRYIDGSAMVDQLIDHPLGQLTLSTRERLGVPDQPFSLVRVNDHDTPNRAQVLAVFEGKYGADVMSARPAARRGDT
ncbi:MAG: hypothetical protein ACRDZO_15450 [Egibacteraceae bacterium]